MILRICVTGPRGWIGCATDCDPGTGFSALFVLLFFFYVMLVTIQYIVSF